MNKRKLIVIIISVILIITAIFLTKTQLKAKQNTDIENTENLIENEITQSDNEKSKGTIVSNEQTQKEELRKKYESKGDRKKVEEITDKIIKYPNNSELYFDRAELYLVLDELEKSYNDYTKAISIDSKQPKYYIKRAWTYRESEISKGEEDILEAKKILKKDDDKILIENYYFFRKNYEKALEELEQLSNKNKNYYDEMLFVFDEMKNKEKTIEFSDAYIKKNPQNINGYLYKGKIYWDNEEYEKVLEIYNEGIKKLKREARLYNQRAEVYIILERYNEAEKDLDKAIELKPENSELAFSYKTKGVMYERIERYKEAAENYRKAIEIDLTDDENSDYRELSVICYGYLIETYTAMGETEKAVESENMKREIEEYRQNLLDGRK